MRRVSDADRDALRGYLPEVLRTRCGVENVNRPFRCPLPDHDDRTPSARYYANGHTVHCFGCGRTVDVFTLVGALDGIEGFPEQVEAVADMVGYRDYTQFSKTFKKYMGASPSRYREQEK